MIDGGDKSPGVVSYLNDYVDGCLEVIVATHPHADHIGGLISVLGSFEVEEIWHNGDSTTSKTYSEFTAAVQSEGADIHVGKRGDLINVGALQFTILNPATLNGTTNNNSLVLSLSYGNIDFLFTGDAEKEAEADMLVSSVVAVLDVEILKVGHHGSNTACSNEFIAAAKPEIAVYMAGEDNRYGHPHEGTIRVLCDVGALGSDVNSGHQTFHADTSVCLFYLTLVSVFSILPHFLSTPPLVPPMKEILSFAVLTWALSIFSFPSGSL